MILPIAMFISLLRAVNLRKTHATNALRLTTITYKSPLPSPQTRLFSTHPPSSNSSYLPPTPPETLTYEYLKTLSLHLLLHDVQYYHYSAPIITDAAYDGMARSEVNIIENNPEWKRRWEAESGVGERATRAGGRVGIPNYSEWYSLLSSNGLIPPSHTVSESDVGIGSVGLYDGVKRFKHGKAMLSLDNALNEKDVVSWVKRVFKVIEGDGEVGGGKGFKVKAEPKIDGVSLSLVYSLESCGSCKFKRAVTRGDGVEGEDVSKQAVMIEGVEEDLVGKQGRGEGGGKVEIEVRGEVVIRREGFEGIKDKYANARNAASGILRSYKNGVDENVGKLVFVAYDVPEVLEDWKGWVRPVREEVLTVSDGDVKALMNYHSKLSSERPNLPYEIDGCVYKVLPMSLRPILGSTARFPRWAIAHKFTSEFKTTGLLNVTTQVGRTGAITPVIEFEGCDIKGVTVKRATGNNWFLVSDVLGADARIGDVITVERAGDVIPKVVKSDGGGKRERIITMPPERCPSCGGDVGYDDRGGEEGGKVLRCLQPTYRTCPAQLILTISHAVSRTCLNVMGLNEGKIKRLVEEGGVKGVVDVMEFDGKGVEEWDGFGEKSRDNMVKEIRDARERGVDLDRFIFALGIRHVGQGVAGIIASNVKTKSKLVEIVNGNGWDEAENWDGVGGVIVESLKEWSSIEDNVEEVSRLVEIVNVNDYDGGDEGSSEGGERGGIWGGRNVVFTGKLGLYSRSEAAKIAAKMGAKVQKDVVKSTSIVVRGEGGGKKIAKAEKLGIAIIEEKEFLEAGKESGNID